MPQKTVVIRIQTQGAGQSTAEFEKLDHALRAMGTDLEDVGRRLSVGVTAPLLAGATLVGKASIDWETAMTGVSKTVDASDAELAALGQRFITLSEDEIPMAAGELAKLAEQAGQLGIAKQYIGDFVETTAALKVSTNLGDQAATSLARLRNITGDSEADISRMGSAIVDLGNNTATTESEIVDLSLRIAGAGKQAHISTAEVLGLGAGLSSLGISAEAGGTAISTVIVETAKAVEMGGPKLQRFAQVAGMTAQQFQTSFRQDAAGAVITFIEGLGRMADQGQNVFQVLEDVQFADRRVRDALLRAAGAGDLLRNAVELGSNAWRENTALAQESEKFYNRMGAELTRFVDKAKNVAAEMGGELEPEFRAVLAVGSDLLDMARGAVRVFGELPAPVQGAVVAMAGMAAVVGPATWALGGMVNGFTRIISLGPTVATGIGVIRTAIAGGAGLAGALSGIGTALLPGGLVIGGLVALGAVLLTVKGNAAKANAELKRIGQEQHDWVMGLDPEQLAEQEPKVKAQLDALTADVKRYWSAFAAAPKGSGLRSDMEQKWLDAQTRAGQVQRALRQIHQRQQELQSLPAITGMGVAGPAASVQSAASMLAPTEEAMRRIADAQDEARQNTQDLNFELAVLRQRLDELDPSSEAAGKVREQIQKVTGSLQDAQAETAALDSLLTALGNQLLATLEPKVDVAGAINNALPFGEISAGIDKPQAKAMIEAALKLHLAPDQLSADAAGELRDSLAAFGMSEQDFINALMHGATSFSDALHTINSDAKGQTDQLVSTAVNGFVGVVQAASYGMDDLARVVLQTLGSVVHDIPGMGIWGTVLGGIGGLLGALTHQNSAPMPVRVDDFSSRAKDALHQANQGPDVVQLIINGQQVTEEEARQLGWTVRRQTREDAVLRMP